LAVPSLISSATSLPSMAAKKAESLASSTSAETAFLERKRRERQRGVDGFARLATVRTRAAGGGRDARGDAQRWITRRHIPEARTALTSASEGESLPPSCACCREGDGREKGLAENPNTRKHERGRSREGRARRAGSDDIQVRCESRESVRIVRMRLGSWQPSFAAREDATDRRDVGAHAQRSPNPERRDPPDSGRTRVTHQQVSGGVLHLYV
jgi:hypothetical protein